MWERVKIDNNDYLISVIRKDDTVKVFLTNLMELWTETLTSEIILNKCRKLNPLLDVDELNYNEIVLNILENVSNHIDEASMVQIKLRVPVEGGFMKFNLNLTKGTPEDFWEIIMKPLCISGMEFMRQRAILLDLIKRKDEEIAEYKAQGAELIRKNIETKFFTEEHLKEDVSNPHTVNCTNAFREILNFHNEFIPCQPSPMASAGERDEIKSEEADTASEQGNTESKNTNDKEESKHRVKRRVAKSKIGTAYLKYKPPPKLKKELEHLPDVLPRRETNRIKRKRCRQCSANGVRKETNYFCPGCKDNPGLCIGKCFREYHKLIATA